MISKPDNSLKVFWGILFEDGSIALDQSQKEGEISEWFKLQKEVEDKGIKPKEIRLFTKNSQYPNGYKKIPIDSNGSSSFFFSKKFVINLGDHNGVQAFGIGCYNRENNTVDITWFDENLDIIETEERNADKCANLMIPRIGTLTSYQN